LHHDGVWIWAYMIADSDSMQELDSTLGKTKPGIDWHSQYHLVWEVRAQYVLALTKKKTTNAGQY